MSTLTVFPGNVEDPVTKQRFDKVAAYLDSREGPVRKHTPSNQDSDAIIECLTVVAGSYIYPQADCLQWPEVLRPMRGELRVSGSFRFFRCQLPF